MTSYLDSAGDEWRRRVARVLGDEAFDALRSPTIEGLILEPLYGKAAEARPRAFRQAGAAPWQIVQRIDDTDPARAGAQAAEDIAEGANVLRLCLAGSDAAFGFGLPASQAADALAGLELDRQPVEICSANGYGQDAAEAVLACLDAARLPPSLSKVSFRLDASMVHVPMVARLLEAGFQGPLACASGRAHHNAGADAVQEIAAVLSSAVAALRTMEQAGLPADRAAERLTLELCADADVFMTLAKFRAVRLLWAEIASACRLPSASIRVDAETSFRMLTRQDVATNMLRNTLAVFAAAVGGADTVCVLPHTLASGLPDAFARRMARNLQIILMDESHLASVADPAAGAGAFEKLTDDLAEAGWQAFQRLEAAGGLAAAGEDGSWAAALARTRQHRAAAIADGRAAILGVTHYPDARERPSATLASRRSAFAFDAFRDAAAFEAGETAA
ncbi:methylmalonyl-CoA mutase family protein [Aureimonas altamirensis]|uniref:methylmalonyl-CoA mutase family protein n=1 Tax=Aureimonas altamirensis TaxID=370622 RepID=UPI001356305D|nr:methylmalonyl-CoA mutase family protein [Aureimonas altamirensis]